MNDSRLNDFDDHDDGPNPFGGGSAAATQGTDADDEAAIARFMQMVDEKIKIVGNPKKYSPKERREAAYWLGDSGDTRAISILVKVYRSDRKNKDVQQAAAYALGQFKALDEAIQRSPHESVADAIAKPENAMIGEHLMNIARSGGGVHRSPISARALYSAMAVLAVTLAIMLVILLVGTGDGGADRRYAERFATLTGAPEQVAVQQARILTDDLKADVQALNRQASDVSLNCALAFNEPIQFKPPQSVTDRLPNLADYAMQYNQQRGQFFAAKADYDSACSSGTTLPTATRGTLQRDEVIFQRHQGLIERR